MELSKANRRRLISDVDIYVCGGCNFKSADIRALHLHLQDHPEGGSYYYNSNLKIAFPKYDTTCSAVQTDDLASIGAKDRASDANSQYFTCHDKEVTTGYFESFDAESTPLAIGSVNRKNDDVHDRDNDFKDNDCLLQMNSINQIFNKCESQMFPDNVNITTVVNSDKGMHNVVKIEPNDSVDDVRDHVIEQNIICNDSLNVNDHEHLDDIRICSKGSEKDIETNKIDNVKVVCQLCNKVYCNTTTLKRHNTKFHKNFTNLELQNSCDSTEINEPKIVNKCKKNHYKKKCPVCEKLMDANNLIIHMRYHNDEKPFQCHLCDNAYRINNRLQDHLKLHEGKINYICQYCGEGSVNYEKYKAHRNSCRKKHVCKVCGIKYVMKGSLTNHMRKHTGDKPFMCQVCGFATAVEKSLKTHIKFKHSNEKTHKCDECDKSFVLYDTLKRHKRVHSKIRPHVCEYCDKCFSESWNLKAHMRQHNGDKPYKCIKCGVGFAHNVVRKTHEAKCHATAEICKTIDKS